MFTGIVETIGVVEHIELINECKTLKIAPDIYFSDLKINDSLSVNGVCLTITDLSDESIYLTAVPETLRLTNLGMLEKNSIVNLERSLKPDTRNSGHYVQGHVDGMGKIIEIKNEGDAQLIKISITSSLSKYIVNKGYITIDGMSITIIKSTPEWFTVTFIPHTQNITIVKNYTVNTFVNIEVDILSKYIEKLLEVRSHE